MFFKSFFDRGAALFGLIFLSPVLIIVGILIRLKMPGGPVIFKQRRVGQFYLREGREPHYTAGSKVAQV